MAIHGSNEAKSEGALTMAGGPTVTNGDLQVIVDGLADELQRSVAIDDPNIRLLAASRHFGDEDAVRVRSVLDRSVGPDLVELVLATGIAQWVAPGRVDVGVEGCYPRLCAPVRCNGLLLGYLWLIDRDGTLTEREARRAAEVADQAGTILYRRLLLHERSKARHEAILWELVSSDLAIRSQAIDDLRAEQLFPEHGVRFQVLGVHFHVDGAPAAAPHEVALEAAVEDGLRAVPDGVSLMAANRSRAWVLFAREGGWPRQMVDTVSERITARFRRLTNDAGRIVAGVGSLVDTPERVVGSYREAFLAARAALLVPTIGDLARWGELGPYELLLKIPVEDLVSASHVPALPRWNAATATGSSSTRWRPTSTTRATSGAPPRCCGSTGRRCTTG